MKRMLLGTTTLVGAILVAQTAAAQLEVTIGGEVSFRAGYADVDGDDGDGDGFDFRTDSEIVVNADGVADNGLEYGAKVEIQTANNNTENADEVSLYIGGGWGRLEFGDFDGAADEMMLNAPGVGLGQFDSWDVFAGDGSSIFNDPRDSGDATKINYYTPRFAGFRVGVAYAPYEDTTDCGRGEAVCIDFDATDDDPIVEDIWEVGADYLNSFGDVKFVASAVGVFGNGVNGDSDINDWGVGARVGFGQFGIGASYAYRDTDSEDWSFSVSALYCGGNVSATVGCSSPWGVGIMYTMHEAGAGDDDAHTLGVGGFYNLAPGLRLAADLYGFQDHSNNIGGDDTDGWVALADIRVSF